MDLTQFREKLAKAGTAYYSLWGGELSAKVYINRKPNGTASSTIIVTRKLDPVMVYTFSTAAAHSLSCEDWACATLTQLMISKGRNHTTKPDIFASKEDDWLTPDPW